MPRTARVRSAGSSAKVESWSFVGGHGTPFPTAPSFHMCCPANAGQTRRHSVKIIPLHSGLGGGIPAPEPSTPSAVPAEDQALLDAYSRAVIDVVDRVGPAVVGLAVRPDRASASGRPERESRRHRLGRRGGAGRPHPHQQPRRRRSRRRRAHRRDHGRRPGPAGAAGRRRSRHRSRAHPRRRGGDAAGGAARRFQAAQARPTGDRHRQSARLRIRR